MDDFPEALDRCLRQVPAGRVATCGAIASALGDVRAARSVAVWILEHPGTPGAHRVVRADGRAIIPAALPRLQEEGVRVHRGRVPRNRIIESLEPVGLLSRLREEQRELAGRVIERDDVAAIRRIAGVDVAYDGDTMYAAAVCVDSRDGRLVEIAQIRQPVSFPYIPTYLTYREFPGIQAAVQRLSSRPDVLMVDGHGRLHPARFGIACDVGIRLDIPTIGIAKHRLAGRPAVGIPREDGAISMELDGRTLGYAWTPPGRGKPIFISIGNRISLEKAMHIVRAVTPHGYPEPLKLADRIGKEIKRNEKREKGAEQ